MQRLMSDASAVVLSGFRLRTEARLVCYPDRYMDKRGERMWQVVTALLKGAGDAVTNRDTFVSANVLRHVTQPVTEHNTRSVFFI